MTKKLHIGIDPGKKGGIALVDSDGVLVMADPFPVIKGKTKKKMEVNPETGKRQLAKDEKGKQKTKKEKDLPDWDGIAALIAKYAEVADDATVERVSGGQSFGRAQAGSFNFGETYGFVCGALLALGIPLTRTPAGVWKGHYGLSDKTDKEASRLLAAKLLPHPDVRYDRVKDDGVAEAGLIALYHKTILNGDDI